MNDINKNDAPQGYIAVEEINGCVGCAFRGTFSCWKDRNCNKHEREDRRDAIFVKAEE